MARHGGSYRPDVTFLATNRCDPEPGGFMPRHLLDSLTRIAVDVPVVRMDVVDVSPPYECRT